MRHLDPVLVGVDGSRASSVAIRFAANEAQRRDRGVHLVHVVPTYVPIAPMAPLVNLDLKETGRAILSAAEDEVYSIFPRERVKASLLGGSRVAALLGASEDACLVVLGSERQALIDRVLTGSTLQSVAADATCSVVAVPSSWSPDAEYRSIVAGVKSTQHSSELIRRAFEVAAERGAGVVLVHAWEVSGRYDDLFSAHFEEQEWKGRAGRAIEACLVGLRETYPDVPLEIRVVHGQPARVLQAESGDADLLLLARRHSSLLMGHLGGTGRALLRAARCPVEVVPPADEPTPVDSLALEEVGTF